MRTVAKLNRDCSGQLKAKRNWNTRIFSGLTQIRKIRPENWSNRVSRSLQSPGSVKVDKEPRNMVILLFEGVFRVHLKVHWQSNALVQAQGLVSGVLDGGDGALSSVDLGDELDRAKGEGGLESGMKMKEETKTVLAKKSSL